MRVTTIEYKIAKWYVYLLTIRMVAQLSVLSNALHGAGVFFDVILHVIGLCLIMLKQRSLPTSAKPARRLFLFFVQVVIFCNLSSIVMAIYTQLTKGSYGADTAFEGIMGMQIYFIQYIFMLLYNMYVFDILGKDKILKILYRLCLFLLILGYVQVASVLNGGIRGLLTSVDVLGVLQPSGDWYKVPLTGSEGASGGSLLACFVFPVLFSKYLVNREKKVLLIIFAFLPIMIFTMSTTGFILFMVCVMSFLTFTSKKNKITVMSIIISLGIILGLAVTLLEDEQRVFLTYLLFEKATDQENGSTASRTVPFYINWGAFTESPIIGVGNGLQGYYYTKYIPSWALLAKGSDVSDFYDQAQRGIANGAVFFPSLLSGYGLLGASMYLIFFIRSFNLVRKNKTQLGGFAYIYLIAFFPIFLCGFQGDFWGNYYIWFLLSIPLFVRNMIQRQLPK